MWVSCQKCTLFFSQINHCFNFSKLFVVKDNVRFEINRLAYYAFRHEFQHPLLNSYLSWSELEHVFSMFPWLLSIFFTNGGIQKQLFFPKNVFWSMSVKVKLDFDEVKMLLEFKGSQGKKCRKKQYKGEENVLWNTFITSS